jgi:hypothetical protein
VETRKGVMIFKLIETEPFDQEKFKKEKEGFAKNVLADRKNTYMEEWLRNAEKDTDLKIDLSTFEDYYQ